MLALEKTGEKLGMGLPGPFDAGKMLLPSYEVRFDTFRSDAAEGERSTVIGSGLGSSCDRRANRSQGSVEALALIVAPRAQGHD